MPLFTTPNIHDDLYEYLGDSYHLLYEDKFDENSITPSMIEYVLKSPYQNYVTIRCNTLHITALICISRSYIIYNNKKISDIQINSVEVDEGYRNKGNFHKFIDIMTEICKNNKRALWLQSVSEPRLSNILNKHTDIYKPQQYCEYNYNVIATCI
jgi:hypothetical protein